MPKKCLTATSHSFWHLPRDEGGTQERITAKEPVINNSSDQCLKIVKKSLLQYDFFMVDMLLHCFKFSEATQN